MRIGVVAVHGVIPQIRFGFQDEVATRLVRALKAQKNGHDWKWTVVLPRNGDANATDIPTISRVHRVDDNPTSPQHDFFDVHEAFWSPIDKGRTSFASIAGWLLKTVFAPFNTFARYREWPLKVTWDIAYVLLATAIAVFLMLFAAMQAANGMRYLLCKIGNAQGATLPHIVCPAPTPPTFPTLFHQILSIFHAETWRTMFDWNTLFAMSALLLSPVNFVKALTPTATVALVCGLIGSYLAWQAFRSLWFVLKGIIQGRHDRLSIASRLIAIALLVASASFFICAEWNTIVQGVGLYLIASVVAFDFGRSYLAWFVTNFFGDVQIYTTRDQNSNFFALREAILQKVESVILNVTTESPAGIAYDRIYILAHSLGSTIAMDALLRLYDITKAPSPSGTPSALDQKDWLRIRAFVTFGTALEKTKYFFNAWAATASQEWEQWNDEIYGGVFTAERSTLAWKDASYGIYWQNSWFFSDFVSDSITTYRSFLLPGETLAERANARASARAADPGGKPLLARVLAENRARFGPWPQHIQTHTWYLEHQWFWHPTKPGDFATIDVLTSGLASLSPNFPFARAALTINTAPPSMPPRATPVSNWEASTFKSWHIER